MPTVAYRRRTPEAEPLYQVLSGHLETFLAGPRASDRQLPLHVEQELRAYLECGILGCGFLRVRCEDCGESRVVAFSCAWCRDGIDARRRPWATPTEAVAR